MKYAIHFYCLYSRYHEIIFTRDKKVQGPICDFLEGLVRRGFNVRIAHTDDEQALGNEYISFCRRMDIKQEYAAGYAHEQNGPAEKSGAFLIALTRVLMHRANLPHSLWPEGLRHAVWLANRRPNRQLDWRTPYEVIQNHYGQEDTPYLGTLKTFGCRVFRKIPDIPHLHKLLERAEIGYLVGIESSNIFRVWIPGRRAVIRTRDVDFDEDTYFDPFQPVRRHGLWEPIEFEEVLDVIPNSGSVLI